MNVRPSREVALYSHRHSVSSGRVLRAAWPLGRVDVVRGLVAALIVSLLAATLVVVRRHPMFRATLDAMDRTAADAMHVTDGTVPHLLADWGSALSSPVWVIAVLALMAVRRLRRWQMWGAPLMLLMPVAVAGVGLATSHLVASSWRAEIAPASVHTTGAVLLCGGISISGLAPSRRRIAASVTLALVGPMVAGWGQLASGTESLDGVLRGAAIGAAALGAGAVLVRGAQRRHFERALERELRSGGQRT